MAPLRGQRRGRRLVREVEDEVGLRRVLAERFGGPEALGEELSVHVPASAQHVADRRGAPVGA